MSQLISSASNISYTENGALTYATSNNRVLDLFSMGGALRRSTSERISELVNKAFKENPIDTLNALFYLRDIRGGMGEKRVYREGIKTLFSNLENKKELSKDFFRLLIEATVELGSWKDVIEIFEPRTYAFYVEEHSEDKNSLMFKWLPSPTGKNRNKAKELAELLNMKPKTYRKLLSRGRRELDLVEIKACENKWEEVKYNKVPSQANLKYMNAFLRHDGERYGQYFLDVKKRKSKVNTSTLYPYQIADKFFKAMDFEGEYYRDRNLEPLEILWKNLPNYSTQEDAIVVADTSGSMEGNPMSISVSLALYFAERNKGRFKDEFITFSENPEFFHIDRNKPLRERIKEVADSDWGYNTNLQKVFDIVLNVAMKENLPQEELPKIIYIISDMEFDEAIIDSSQATNYEAISEKFRNKGYRCPSLIFWNVNSRQNNISARESDPGVALVSGSSPSIFEMMMSQDIDPLKFMNKVIHKEKYTNFSKKIMKEFEKIQTTKIIL